MALTSAGVILASHEETFVDAVAEADSDSADTAAVVPEAHWSYGDGRGCYHGSCEEVYCGPDPIWSPLRRKDSLPARRVASHDHSKSGPPC